MAHKRVSGRRQSNAGCRSGKKRAASTIFSRNAGGIVSRKSRHRFVDKKKKEPQATCRGGRAAGHAFRADFHGETNCGQRDGRVQPNSADGFCHAEMHRFPLGHRSSALLARGGFSSETCVLLADLKLGGLGPSVTKGSDDGISAI